VGLYYDSEKLELVTFIDTSDFGITGIKEISEKPVQIDTTYYSREYSVLLRRKYTEQEKNQITRKYDRLPAYSFIAMSYHALASCPEDSKKEITDSFWKCVSQVQRIIRPTKTSLFPIVLAVHGDIDIGMKDHELPETWVYCRNKTGNQKESMNENCFCYCGSDTYPKMFMSELQDFDHTSKCNYTKKQWEKLKALWGQLPFTTNHQFRMAFLGFKC
jgi:hypothetical protein